jgi:hypothetical protein
MSDRGRITLGLGAFLVLAAYPAWNGLNTAAARAQPELEPATDATECVESTEFMTPSHQQLLNEWRTAVVRDGERTWVSASGTEWEMSLTGTCLSCHRSQEAFCQQCHDYAGADPTCWSCHVAPEGG